MPKPPPNRPTHHSTQPSTPPPRHHSPSHLAQQNHLAPPPRTSLPPIPLAPRSHPCCSLSPHHCHRSLPTQPQTNLHHSHRTSHRRSPHLPCLHRLSPDLRQRRHR